MAAQLNMPFGAYRLDRGDLDLKFRVANNEERNELITKDRVEIGHIIYHVDGL